MSQLFEKDTITAIVNRQLTPQLALRIGQALAYVVSQNCTDKVRILTGKDTRASGDMLDAALCAGVCSMGADVVSLGVIPAPAASFLAAKYKMDAAVMISAAQHPIEYNGIRLLDSQGLSLGTEQIKAIEEYALGKKEIPSLCAASDAGRIRRTHTGLRDYVDYVKSTAKTSLSGLKIAIDSANGSCFECTKLVFTELGADVESINNRPDGVNINANCGIVAIETLGKFVVSHKCTVGLSFDGDGTGFAVVNKSGQRVSVPSGSDAIVSALAYVCDLADKMQ